MTPIFVCVCVIDQTNVCEQERKRQKLIQDISGQASFSCNFFDFSILLQSILNKPVLQINNEYVIVNLAFHL